MKIICLQENLKNGLNITQNIIGKNLTLPILNNLLLQTENGRLRISSTNLEIGINTWVSGKIEKEGAITCPAKILTSFINNLPNKKVELEVKNNILTVRCENFKANFNCLSSEDFPIIPKIDQPILMEIKGTDLKEGLLQVFGIPAISESRPEITGILFNFSKNELKLAATDSFRLAEKKISANGNEKSLIIPQKTAFEISRIFGEKENLVKISLGSSQILFENNETQLLSRIIEGQYPDYKQIIPSKSTTEIIVNRDEIINAIKIAGLFSSKVNNISLVFKGNKFEIISKDQDLGENKSVLDIEMKGDDLDIKLNYRYLLDGLNNIKTKKIFMAFNSGSSPVVIKPMGESDYIYLLMPINN